MSSYEPFIWINGVVLPNQRARVSPLDRGFLAGDGVFETLRVYDGEIFAINRHWLRLVRSCLVLGIPSPSHDVFFDAMQRTLNASGLRDARMRFTVTSGEGPLVADRSPQECTMVCSAVPSPAHAETERVVTVPWTRNEQSALAGAKCVSYAENLVALAHARRMAAGEAVFPNTRSELCEGATSNVFLVQGDTLHTPPLSSGCLDGVTRGLVIELCHEHGIPVSEAPVPMARLADCCEAFLTSSTREVHPIAEVDGRTLSRTVGPLTKRVAELFRNLVRENTDP